MTTCEKLLEIEAKRFWGSISPKEYKLELYKAGSLASGGFLTPDAEKIKPELGVILGDFQKIPTVKKDG